jgi:hypothetical protein
MSVVFIAIKGKSSSKYYLYNWLSAEPSKGGGFLCKNTLLLWQEKSTKQCELGR